MVFYLDMAAGKLEELGRAGKLKSIVAMNDHDIVRYGEDGKFGLATRDLKSCHAVAIVSQSAAILTHIAPLAPEPIRNNFPISEDWIEAMMARVVQCFTVNKQLFAGPGAGGIIIYGIYQGQTALPHQVDVLANTVKNVMKLPTTPVHYTGLNSRLSTRGPNKGIVVIEGKQAPQRPTV